MEGDETGVQEGIIPKTIKKIFEQTHALEEKSWKYTLSASFLEIYNEEIRDLLALEKGLKYDIKKMDAKSNEIYVTNLKSEDVTCGNNIQSLLKRAKKNRAVAATNCNERSSRSHSVFMLKIVGKNSITSESCTGTLNLVDLAGSERYVVIFFLFLIYIFTFCLILQVEGIWINGSEVGRNEKHQQLFVQLEQSNHGIGQQ